MYRLFSPTFYAVNPVRFEERRIFFNALRERQQQSDPPLFTKELSNTCPCCGYPVFDIEGGRSGSCLLCGWLFHPVYEKSDLKIALMDARKAFEEDMIAIPLTPHQPWMGWDTPIDLRLHLVLASAFNSMVGESRYDILEHTLELCHQLLSYQAFRRDVGMRLWESHRKAVESQKTEAFEFNEEEVENTFYQYVDAENWAYLNYFLIPIHCLSISFDPETDLVFNCPVDEIESLEYKDWLYFVVNLQIDDPLFLFEIEDEDGQALIEVCDFTGKHLGVLSFLRSVEVLERMNDGEYFVAAVSTIEIEMNRLKVNIDVVSCAGLPV